MIFTDGEMQIIRMGIYRIGRILKRLTRNPDFFIANKKTNKRVIEIIDNSKTALEKLSFIEQMGSILTNQEVQTMIKETDKETIFNTEFDVEALWTEYAELMDLGWKDVKGLNYSLMRGVFIDACFRMVMFYKEKLSKYKEEERNEIIEQIITHLLRDMLNRASK